MDEDEIGHRRMIVHLRDERACDEAVLMAMDSLRRKDFLPPGIRSEANRLAPVPIGCGQTMSAPFIVASMTYLLQTFPGARVLEIGTGCGYQSAVLIRMGVRLWSIEIIPEIAELARANLQSHHMTANLRVGDGTFGWPEEAPFDRILVAASAPRIPERLLEQLVPGGIMVLPLKEASGGERMVRVRRKADGGCDVERLYSVRFVPMVGEIQK